MKAQVTINVEFELNSIDDFTNSGEWLSELLEKAQELGEITMSKVGIVENG